NTSFNWREHSSNLLSAEFLRLARRHLNPGGVLYYNTTGSGEVLLTGATVFPHALRVANFLAVSDAPLTVDSDRLARTLRDYRIEGKPVLDASAQDGTQVLDSMMALTHRFDSDTTAASLEHGDSLRARYGKLRVITDDNMGT